MLKHLKLTNFRNYSSLSLDFDQRPTILLGNNAVGKSNLLEAVYFLSTTKSPRVEVESELIKEGENFAIVSGLVEDDELEIGLQNTEGQFSKRVKVNGVPRRVVDFIGHLPAVIFYPSDINMVTGPPSLRRWHLDMALAQIDSDYKKNLTLFEQVLTSRNKVLKRIREGEGGLDELVYWTEELIKYGQVISKKRQTFFSFINQLDKPLGPFEFIYHESKLTEDRLDQYSSREIASASTLIGPHRDDFTLSLNGKNLAHFGSRGEQRTSTLAFKLSQLEYMAQTLGKRPILLLDDVFSELDAKHRTSIIDIVGKQQTLLATVELEHIPKKFLEESRILKVEDGKIIE